MIQVKHVERSEDIRQDARHILFVEGSNDAAFDPSILNEIIPTAIRVKASAHLFT